MVKDITDYMSNLDIKLKALEAQTPRKYLEFENNKEERKKIVEQLFEHREEIGLWTTQLKDVEEKAGAVREQLEALLLSIYEMTECTRGNIFVVADDLSQDI